MFCIYYHTQVGTRIKFVISFDTTSSYFAKFGNLLSLFYLSRFQRILLIIGSIRRVLYLLGVMHEKLILEPARAVEAGQQVRGKDAGCPRIAFLHLFTDMGDLLMEKQVVKSLAIGLAFAGAVATAPRTVQALTDCDDLPNHAAAQAALSAAVAQDNGGFGLNMWVSIVNRDGEVCVVAFTGGNRGDQWPGSRVISAQKANTANAFSLPGLALSTANLWAATQPGGSLFGLQFSNPVDTAVAYGDDPGDHKGSDADDYGDVDDPMVGEIVGGVNVFGGGLALYDSTGKLLGALGVSGDTSCADHNIAWRTRDALGLDHVPFGVGTPGDNIIFDIADDAHGNPESAGGFGHPQCGNADADADDEATENGNVIAACPLNDGATPGCT